MEKGWGCCLSTIVFDWFPRMFCLGGINPDLPDSLSGKVSKEGCPIMWDRFVDLATIIWLEIFFAGIAYP